MVELAAAGGGELRRAQVDRDGTGTTPDESGLQVGTAAPDLDHVEPGDVPEQVEVVFPVPDQSPRDLGRAPPEVRVGVGEPLVDELPQLAVALDRHRPHIHRAIMASSKRLAEALPVGLDS